MDEFARLMSMEGVRPLDQSKGKSPHVVKRPRQDSNEGIVAPSELGPR